MCDLDESQFHEQTFVRRLAVVDVALVHQLEGLIEESCVALLGLLLIALALLVAHLEQGECLRVLGHHDVAHVLGKALDEQSAIETLVDD